MNMVNRIFRVHGELCASRPWEVIIGTLTLTVCIMSMSLFAVDNKICGWNYRCEQSSDDDTKSSDVIILTLTRSIAVIYIYLQFTNLRKLGSKYLLGVVGLFTVFSSFVFSIGVINIFGSDLTGLNEALPFFVLLVDLSKACTLAKFAFSAASQDEVVENIGRGMALLGPMLTLDALVEALVIGIGTLSGVKILQTMCCFGCLSVIANYLAFMTFYPACLALFIELSRGSRPIVQIQKLAKIWLENEQEDKPNPVTQRVKIIMSAGLMFVHAHSRLVVGEGTDGFTSNEKNLVSQYPSLPLEIVPEIPLWQFYIQKTASLSVDYVLTLALAVILGVKYVAFDKDTTDTKSLDSSDDLQRSSIEEETKNASNLSQLLPAVSAAESEPVIPYLDSTVQSSEQVMPAISEGTQTDQQHRMRGSMTFTLGDDSSDDSDMESSVSTVRIVDVSSVETQTEDTEEQLVRRERRATTVRPLHECSAILKTEDGASQLNDEEIIALVNCRQIAVYQLESVLGDCLRAVAIRRRLVTGSLPSEMALDNLPYLHYDYKFVHRACCENVIGHVPVPVGFVKPLLLDGKRYTVPMATTEGCLIASTNRGCRALELAGGVASVVTKDGMSRAPVVRFNCAKRADEARRWLENKTNYENVAEAFNSTSRFARLLSIEGKQVAHTLHLRFVTLTGDAMGMNMVSKGCEKALNLLKEEFPDMQILSLSGNFCTDKKSSAVNWVEGRGKSVICDAVIPARIVSDVLKTSAAALVDLNVAKNLVGSAVSGSIGGFNAHAANIVTAIFIATGQDPAQNVCSSNCITLMETCGHLDDDLYVSCTMPTIEVGTVGGGTVLPPQAACLEMLGIRGSNVEDPGANARTLAQIICATVMAGELSLMSALTTGDLVKSHLKHNRSVLNMASSPSVDTFSGSAQLPRDSSTSASSSSIRKTSQNLGSCLKS